MRTFTASIHCIIISLFIAGIDAQDVYVANPFVQPNDSTLNWYGSGDANGDDTLTWEDVTRMQELIDQTFSDPDDIRLHDRADVNGDLVVDALDKTMLEEHMTSEPFFQPRWYWNKLQTRAEREDWLVKMLAIDDSENTCDGIPPEVICNCNQYAIQAFINFADITDPAILAKMQEYGPFAYDVENGGRFNLPLFKLITQDYNPDGSYFGGHAMNWTVVGNDLTSWDDICNVEPQEIYPELEDNINIQAGEGYIIGENAEIIFRGPPEGPGGNPLRDYLIFEIIEQVPSLTYINDHHDFILRKQRDLTSPQISTTLEEGAYFHTGSNASITISDDYPKRQWYSIDGGLSKIPLSEGTNSITLPSEVRDYQMLIYAGDDFYNEVLDTVEFAIEDLLPPIISIISPSQGESYHEKNVLLEWSIEDPNFKDAWYSLDGGATTTTLGKAGSALMELEDGDYELLLMAVDTAGNENIDTVSFTVDIWGTNTPEQEAENSHLKIYPNPTNDVLTIETKELGRYTIEIVSVNGQLIHSEEVSGPIHQIDLSPFQAGEYFITIRSVDSVTTRKVVKL